MEIKIKCRNCGKETIMEYGEFINGNFCCYCGSTSGEIIETL